jgi:adenylate cyclase
LEGLNKEYGTHIIVSEATYKHVRDVFLCRVLDVVAVKGKSHPSRVYELVSHREDADHEQA